MKFKFITFSLGLVAKCINWLLFVFTNPLTMRASEVLFFFLIEKNWSHFLEMWSFFP